MHDHSDRPARLTMRTAYVVHTLYGTYGEMAQRFNRDAPLRGERWTLQELDAPGPLGRPIGAGSSRER